MGSFSGCEKKKNLEIFSSIWAHCYYLVLKVINKAAFPHSSFLEHVFFDHLALLVSFRHTGSRNQFVVEV